MSEEFKRRLIAEAAAPFKRAGRYAYHFARGKLGGDPVFAAMLRDGLLPPSVTVLDLGCGEALLASWLRAASLLHADGDWPSDWPAPPHLEDYRGIELQPRDVARARRALPTALHIEHRDIREASFGRASLVVILDVLHYIGYQDQRRVLERIRTCLEPDGVLLLRVGDAAGGVPFRISLAVDALVTRLRGQSLGRLHCRTLADWRAELSVIGFAAKPMPMSAGTPFANHLLVAHPRSLSDLGGSKRGSGRARPFRSGFEAHSGSM
ncbi:class I SAM-dependent methyltransferase [Thiorhodococcus mannitoliphagus]|uniref:Class I SAM-dependent methyltransferase n=1 Tax=Thiorhodococcus mannitoliphagus TaxID=329406 RepID=A0A6P1DUM9_9GAMM|nr:class I SAM-dependent methyltransferase [Thiorhodococcus mannitoliphagus]NEX20396.1 class I SAM-dependent methyltransferase [Thiorhodococcus mannitoliphagus]